MSVIADAAVRLEVAAHPAVGRRLLGGVESREDLTEYLAGGGYAPIADEEHLLAELEASGLRGRGGAAFPTFRKVQTVRAGRDVPVVVGNGEEGEPASVKDRWLLRHRPHLVLDGLRLAAAMIGSADMHVYLSDPESDRSVRQAIDELTASGRWDGDVTVTRVEPAYVAGEETAVVRAINGGPALPSDKPPRPFEEGVLGRPTLVSNVETLANLALIQRLGASRYRDIGTVAAPGSFLLTLTGCEAVGLYEVPLGITVRDVLTWRGVDVETVTGFLMGGYFSGVIGTHVLDTPLDYDSLRDVGSGLGCGAVSVLTGDSCPVAVAAAVMTYFDQANAGQCGSCFNGTAAMSAVLSALVDFQADKSDLDRLRGWSTFLRGRGACGTLDGATNVAASLLTQFPEVVDAHMAGRCENCASGRRINQPPFAAALPVEG